MAHDQDERHAPARRPRRLRPYTARSLFADRAIDAVMRVLGAPARLLVLVLVALVATDLVWRVLAVAGVCR
jgi:hypothetical protein